MPTIFFILMLLIGSILIVARPLWQLHRIIERQLRKSENTKQRIRQLVNHRNILFFNSITKMEKRNLSKIFTLRDIHLNLEKNHLTHQKDFDHYQELMKQASVLAMELVVGSISHKKPSTDQEEVVAKLKQYEQAIEAHVKHYHKLAGSVNTLSKKKVYLILFKQKNLPTFRGLSQNPPQFAAKIQPKVA